MLYENSYMETYAADHVTLDQPCKVRVEAGILTIECGFHDTWTLSPRSFGHSFHAHLDT